MRGMPWKLRFESDVDPGPRTQMHTYLQYLNTSLQSIQYGLQTLFATTVSRHIKSFMKVGKDASTVNRTLGLKIFSLTLSKLSYWSSQDGINKMLISNLYSQQNDHFNVNDGWGMQWKFLFETAVDPGPWIPQHTSPTVFIISTVKQLLVAVWDISLNHLEPQNLSDVQIFLLTIASDLYGDELNLKANLAQ